MTEAYNLEGIARLALFAWAVVSVVNFLYFVALGAPLSDERLLMWWP